MPFSQKVARSVGSSAPKKLFRSSLVDLALDERVLAVEDLVALHGLGGVQVGCPGQGRAWGTGRRVWDYQKQEVLISLLWWGKWNNNNLGIQ